MPLKRTLEILNELERSGVISAYAIGGAMGATFYVEPLLRSTWTYLLRSRKSQRPGHACATI